ncbi:RNA-directed DNA polymerase (Reverse transcriptase), partial [Trifolium medium]|nr:RNA-directed DNA polymerase (Reverse transcriptase) [Trifolium medium]
MREGRMIPQSLIKWKNKSMEDVTWEDNEMMRGQFPNFILEDKDIVKEGAIDRGGAE